MLIELEGDELVSELDIVEGQWFEILARKSRLSAERDGLDAIAFDPELVARADASPEIAGADRRAGAAVRGPAQAAGRGGAAARRAADARSASRSTAWSALAGRDRRPRSTCSRQELEGQEKLLDQGLTQITRVLALQRELARLRGTVGQVEATIAENRGKIAEIDIELVRLDLQGARGGDRRAARPRVPRDRAARAAALAQGPDRQARPARAGRRASSTASTADTLRGVIRAAEPIMYIVPKDAALIVRGRIETDRHRPGARRPGGGAALLGLRPAHHARGRRPRHRGLGRRASRTRRPGMRYYSADIRLDDGMREKLGDLVLLPGMPVEAFIEHRRPQPARATSSSRWPTTSPAPSAKAEPAAPGDYAPGRAMPPSAAARSP